MHMPRCSGVRASQRPRLLSGACCPAVHLPPPPSPQPERGELEPTIVYTLTKREAAELAAELGVSPGFGGSTGGARWWLGCRHRGGAGGACVMACEAGSWRPEQPTWPAFAPMRPPTHPPPTHPPTPLFLAGAGAEGPAGPGGRLPRRPVGGGAPRGARRLHARPPHAGGGHSRLWHGCAGRRLLAWGCWDFGLGRLGFGGRSAVGRRGCMQPLGLCFAWPTKPTCCLLTNSPTPPMPPGIDKGNVRHVYQ